MFSHKRILVAPLDWGLGHASRCVPIIKELQRQGATVIICASNKPLDFLLNEFPGIEHVVIPGMNVAYPKRISLSIFMAIKAPKFLKSVREEYDVLKSLVDSYNIHGVISDNRYGMYHKTIPTVFITHQLFIKASIFSGAVNTLTEKYASRFTFCWVPDFKSEPNLAGELAHGDTDLNNLRFIGPLSRFAIPKYYTPTIRYDLLVVLSGPEPSRTQLEETIIKQLKDTKLKVLLVRGLVNSAPRIEEKYTENITRLNYLNTEELEKAILISDMILCRSGYSSIMDLSVLKKKALFVPTKGQTEQLYLAKKLKAEGKVFYTSRARLKIEKHLKVAKNYEGLDLQLKPELLEDAVRDFLALVD